MTYIGIQFRAISLRMNGEFEYGHYITIRHEVTRQDNGHPAGHYEDSTGTTYPVSAFHRNSRGWSWKDNVRSTPTGTSPMCLYVMDGQEREAKAVMVSHLAEIAARLAAENSREVELVSKRLTIAQKQLT